MKKIISVNNKYIIILFLVIWLTAEYIFLGKYSYVNMFDMADLHIPIGINVKNLFLENGFFYWYPNLKSGVDLISQGYFFTNFVAYCIQFFILPDWLVYPLTKFTTLFLCGLFTFKISNQILNYSSINSYLSAFIYMIIAGNFDSEGLISKPLFPLYLFFFYYLNNLRFSVSKLLLFFAFSILYASSSFLLWDYFSLFIILLFCFFYVRDKKSYIYFSIFFVLIIIFYQLNILIPLVYNSSDSHRILDNFNLYNVYLNQIYNEVTLSHHKNNQFVFIIFVFSLCIYNIKNVYNNNQILLSLLVVNIVLGLSIPISQLILKDYIQAILAVESGRSFKITFHFLIAMIAGNFLIKNNNNLKYFSIFSILIIFTIIPKINHMTLYMIKGHSYSNLFESELLKQISEKNEENFRVVSITSDTINSPISQNVLMAYGFEQASGYSSMHSKKYDNFWMNLAGWNGNRLYLSYKIDKNKNYNINHINFNLLSLLNVKYVFSDKIIKNKNLNNLYSPNILGTISADNLLSKINKYYLKVLQNHNGKNFYIYENKNVIPRFFITNNYILYENIDDLNKSLNNNSINFLKTNVLYLKKNEKYLQNNNLNSNYSKLELLKYSPDYIKLKYSSDGDNILIVSNTYSKFWSAYVDGKKKMIIPAYENFWSVSLKQNDKIIEFKYEPPYRIYN